MAAQKVAAVPGTAKQGTDALDPPRGWAEASIWTERLVSALVNGVKGGKSTLSSRLMGCSPLIRPMCRRDTPDEDTNDWRAVCGRTARTVRRALRLASALNSVA